MVTTSAQIMRAEQHTIASGVSVETLMEKAGQSVFDVIVARHPKQSVQVLCGPGNNGGDGYVVARLLLKAGWPVQVLEHTPSKAHSRSLWTGETLNLSPDVLQDCLTVDALFGIGLQRDLTGLYGQVIAQVNQHPSPTVAIDIPSGINADTGALMGVAIQADVTVTFDFRKPGHLLLPGKSHCGELVVQSIGLKLDPAEIKNTYINNPLLWQDLYPLPNDAAHKYSRGFLSILGGAEMTGAARLASAAARRMGVGMVRIESAPSVHELYKSQSVGVLTTAIDSGQDFAQDTRISATLIGPGSGGNDFTKQAVTTWLATRKPCVLDADALTVFKDNPQELFKLLYPEVILTPHAGEFEKLFPVSKSKIEMAQKAAQQSGATILFKGSDTVIAHPSGLIIIQQQSCPYLATGGTGDVLAGMIASLLAQGMPPLAAAACANFIHTTAANKIGLGLIAEDLPAMIPEVLQELFLKV